MAKDITIRVTGQNPDGTMTVQQSQRVDVTTLRQPKPRQYAQPVK